MASDVDRPRPEPRRVPAQREVGFDRVRKPEDSVQLVSAGIGLARLTLGVSTRLGGWALGASLRVGNRVLRAAVQGENATTLLENATEEIRDQARDLLGIVDSSGRVVGIRRDDAPPRRRELPARAGQQELRERGAALLDASRDVTYDEPFHPAYARIMDDLAPDEARILRLLATEGPQPVVDIQSATGIGGRELIKRQVTMIGAQAGVRFRDRVASYLTNLERLGLVWTSPNELEHSLYEVLEAQPEASEVLKETRRAKTVRRSIAMTPFGEDFVATCLPLGGGGGDDEQR